MSHRHLAFALLAASAPSVPACAAPSSPSAGESAEAQEQGAVSDITKMVARGDGTFDVTCRDGKREIVSAADVEQNRVCKKAVFPGSPFQVGACTGTPMTEDGARARLAGGPNPAKIGSYVFALRRRETSFGEPGNPFDDYHYWVDAPQDRLAAWRETETTRGQPAVFSLRGDVEIASDASGAPYLRLVGEAANVVGPDTTRFMRVVSKPLRPWAQRNYPVGPDFALEQSNDGTGTWSPVTEYGWSVTTSERDLVGPHRSWHFIGNDVTAFVTERCGQFISSQSISGLSPTRAAIGIAIVFD